MWLCLVFYGFFFFFSRCLEVEGEREGKGREREIVKKYLNKLKKKIEFEMLSVL